MSRVGQIIELSSAQFPPSERDHELVNHETMHGFELARYIADRLPEHGFELADMVPEDWGWWCEVKNDGYVLAYGCSGDRTEDFLIQVSPDKPNIRRWFKKIDVEARVEALLQAIFSILESSGKCTHGPAWSG